MMEHKISNFAPAHWRPTVMLCQACQETCQLDPLGEIRHDSSLQRSASVYSRAEVIVIHTPSTSGACETHAHLVEKSITSPAS
jgi:hypothetical protein